MPRLVSFLLVLASGAALAAPGGRIDALGAGTYICELPGDATGAAGLRQPAESFEIINANSYRNDTGRGAYLLTGDVLTMTSGPKRGQRFHRISDRFLRRIGPGGQDGPLRCVRRVVNNG